MRGEDYSPFSGWTSPSGAASGSSQLGERLKRIDWGKTQLVPGKWVVPSAAPSTSKPEAASHKPAHAAQKRAAPAPVDAPAWRAEHGITVFGEDCPAPFLNFTDVSMPASILDSFSRQGFTGPTPIQSQSWPILFSHRDIVGIAKTGSGKTLAFMIPGIVHTLQQDPMRQGDGPIVLALAPTRELAQQIEVETRKVLPSNLRCGCIYGGAPKGDQVQMLRMGMHIMVATPGRLIDFLGTQRTNLFRTTYVVLDEADRMLDMGFEPQIRQILSQVREDRQTLMFSATWPKEIRDLAATFQRNFIRIHVGSTELLANPDVKQHFRFVTENEKWFEVKNVLRIVGQQRVLIFTKMKRTCERLDIFLRGNGFNCVGIHGDKDQRQREFALERFRREQNIVLVATDVAARGLDVKDLDVVINFDFAMNVEDYVHRIGRTGRAGKAGDAYSFLTTEQANIAKDLVALLNKSKQEVPQELKDMCATRGAPRYGPGYGHGRFGRAPQSHFHHSNRPSFDASGSDALHTRTVFGVESPSAAGDVPAGKRQRTEFTE